VFIENHKLNVDAVIFDLDGTLIDSAPVYDTLQNETPDAIIDSIVHLMEAIIQLSAPNRS
jgi:beta-phosphoglucomutase-like phosphatase (HAD superfamily)